MFYKVLLSIFLVIFITACTTTPKDSADVSGSGSSTSADSVSSSDSSDSSDSSSDSLSIVPG